MRQFIPGTPPRCALLFAFAMVGLTRASAETPVFKQKLNVLLIVADDLRAELGCLGNDKVISPNMDGLAKRGRLFRRAYCQQAVCNPSRASFMTGLRPDSIRVWDLKTHFRQAKPHHPTLPQLFKTNGYEARCIGKVFHNSEPLNDPPSWSKPAKYQAGPHWADTIAARRGAQRKQQTPATEQFDVADDAYLDGKIAREAVAALEQLKDRPFFLAVGFWRPHLPFVAPKRDWDLYRELEQPAISIFQPPHGAPAVALHDSRELKGYAEVPNFPLAPSVAQHLRRGYFASVTFMDRQVGILLDGLTKLGLDSRTVVVFLSDHGFHLGEHGLWCKTSCYELDARVPLIISTPGAKHPGTSTDAIVELVDLYPTIASLANLKSPRVDGVSLLPILDNPRATVKAAAFTQHPRPAYSQTPAPIMGVSVRTSEARYTEWRHRAGGKLEGVEFYDHRIDPAETKNLADDEGYRQQIDAGAQRLQARFP